VNVHASLLPRWRGAAPVQWSLAEGDSETGVTLMRLEEGLDTGPTFAQVRTTITASDTSASLLERLAPMGAQLLQEALPDYLSGKRVPQAQPTEGITLAPPLKKEQGQLDFTESATVLERRVRAFTPWPSVFTTWQGRRIKVLEAAVVGGQGRPGTVVAVGSAGLDVACREGTLRLLRLQLEGKRAMSAAEFLSGNRFAVGESPFSRVEVSPTP
jgi:methionyl-tRNA formyltransferase